MFYPVLRLLLPLFVELLDSPDEILVGRELCDERPENALNDSAAQIA